MMKKNGEKSREKKTPDAVGNGVGQRHQGYGKKCGQRDLAVFFPPNSLGWMPARVSTAHTHARAHA